MATSACIRAVRGALLRPLGHLPRMLGLSSIAAQLLHCSLGAGRRWPGGQLWTLRGEDLHSFLGSLRTAVETISVLTPCRLACSLLSESVLREHMPAAFFSSFSLLLGARPIVLLC